MKPVPRLACEAAHRIIDECRKRGIVLVQDGRAIVARPRLKLRDYPPLMGAVVTYGDAILQVLHDSVN